MTQNKYALRNLWQVIFILGLCEELFIVIKKLEILCYNQEAMNADVRMDTLETGSIVTVRSLNMHQCS